MTKVSAQKVSLPMGDPGTILTHESTAQIASQSVQLFLAQLMVMTYRETSLHWCQQAASYAMQSDTA